MPRPLPSADPVMIGGGGGKEPAQSLSMFGFEIVMVINFMLNALVKYSVSETDYLLITLK